ncbi:Ras-related GTP-binding protein [Candidatus Thiomargarita nelsonii]|uniref:Ras-related GTP-binding protein n=1 Tax=Candidatus Thiomargarita nelsonii TaxID=1003181 RepID=A0A0A6P1T6_9GAMM|nr:Ras-related GTP-binding protein [Candidatus Thiomargarita nelsonii]
MLQKKICMIGDFGVGKTSLISRFVRETFSEKYLTTVGVKIDSKLVKLVDGREIKLILWDIAGNNTLATSSYLRGAAGFLLVVDGTRRPTWETALNLRELVIKELGEKPFIILLNKADLEEQWEMDEEVIQQQGCQIFTTSAKTGMNVEKAFIELASLADTFMLTNVNNSITHHQGGS